ncbi:RNA-directed DNA polymerase, eukaryota, reverse transcriptase zinc-binding domain protein [Tanacetum coccineum]
MDTAYRTSWIWRIEHPGYGVSDLLGTAYRTTPVRCIGVLGLSKVIDKVVSNEQSAFISGRYILDGPLMLSEVMSCYKKKKRNMLLFKVDFEKAFDSISWKFLDYMLLSLRSAFALKNAVSLGLIQGASIGESGFKLSHFFYVDDVVIISDWNMQDMSNIIHVLNVLYHASGCGSDHFWAKLSSWKASTLSIGGHLTLIKSVLGSLGIYYMSIFKCPESVLNSLEAMRASFFRGGSRDKRKMSWLKWEKIMASFDKGGLNIRSLKAFNLALLQK